MTDKSIHTSSVSDWSVASREPLIYSLKQMMRSKKISANCSNIWGRELSFAHPGEAEVRGRGCLLYWKSLLQTLTWTGGEFGLGVCVWGWSRSWGRHGLISPRWAQVGAKSSRCPDSPYVQGLCSHHMFRIRQNTTARAAHRLL